MNDKNNPKSRHSVILTAESRARGQSVKLRLLSTAIFQLTLLIFFLLPRHLFAADLTGLWEGSFTCSGDNFNWQVILTHPAPNRIEGEALFIRASDGAQGRHGIRGQYNERSGLVRANGSGWIERVPRRGQLGFSANHNRAGTSISGRFVDGNCSELLLNKSSNVAQFTGLSAPASAAQVSTQPAAPDQNIAGRGRTNQANSGTQVTQTRGRTTNNQSASNDQNSSIRGGRTNGGGRAGATQPASGGAPAVAVNCSAVTNWFSNLDTAYPGADFNMQRRYGSLAYLFLDEVFVPAFGRPYSEFDITGLRETWRGNSLASCFGGANENVMLRQNLERAFTIVNGDFSYPDVQQLTAELTQKRQGVQATVEQLNRAPAGSEPALEVEQLANEGSIEIVGLPFPDKEAYRNAVARLFPERQDGPAVSGAPIMAPGARLVQEREIFNTGAFDRNLALLAKCDLARAGEYKMFYLDQITRLYGDRRTEAEEVLDLALEDHLDDNTQCLDEQVVNYDRRIRDSLDWIWNYTRGGAGIPGVLVPEGFKVSTTRPDDPDELKPVNSDSRLIPAGEAIRQASALGSNVALAESCGMTLSGELLTDYSESVGQVYPDIQQSLPSSYELGYRLSQQSIETSIQTSNQRGEPRSQCSEDLLQQYRTTIEGIVSSFGTVETLSRGELAAREEARIDAAGPGIFDPDLFARIRGEHDEINQLGVSIDALQAGTIWWRKYRLKYEAMRGHEFDYNMEYFERRRLADFVALAGELEATLNNIPEVAEVDTFVATHMGVRTDYRDAASGRFFALAETRKIEITKQQEYERMVAQYENAPRFNGEFGPLELVDAMINSRIRALNFQRRFSVANQEPGNIATQLRNSAWNSASWDEGTAEFERTGSGWYSPTIREAYAERLSEFANETEVFQRMYDDAVNCLLDC
jgi:hypothetical protein